MVGGWVLGGVLSSPLLPSRCPPLRWTPSFSLPALLEFLRVTGPLKGGRRDPLFPSLYSVVVVGRPSRHLTLGAG